MMTESEGWASPARTFRGDQRARSIRISGYPTYANPIQATDSEIKIQPRIIGRGSS
jgi:hypothetical protein